MLLVKQSQTRLTRILDTKITQVPLYHHKPAKPDKQGNRHQVSMVLVSYQDRIQPGSGRIRVSCLPGYLVRTRDVPGAIVYGSYASYFEVIVIIMLSPQQQAEILQTYMKTFKRDSHVIVALDSHVIITLCWPPSED